MWEALMVAALPGIMDRPGVQSVAPLVAHLMTDRVGASTSVIQTTHVYRRHSS